LTDIVVEGVSNGKKELARSELSGLMEMFLMKGKENPIKSIIVAKDFNLTVRTLLDASSGGADYDSRHEYGVAVAKVIPQVENNQLLFVLVLSGEAFGEWPECSYLDRMALIAHEFIHMYDGRHYWELKGTDLPERPSHTKGGILRNLAWAIWEEYHAERVVWECVKKVVEDSKHKNSIHLVFSRSMGHAEDLEKLVSSLRTYLRQNVAMFRLSQLSIDEIARRVLSKVEGILVLSAYVSAIVDIHPPARERMTQIEQSKEWTDFCGESWSEILRSMGRMCDMGSDYDVGPLDNISDMVEEILRKCGLEISDTREGIYVKVLDI
jgi:hypothetical protein